MIEMLCFGMVIILAFLTGQVFRKQYKKNAIANCLAMLVVMTMSTTIGIIIGTWVLDMVLSTIISILVSVLLSIVLTAKLSVKILIESMTMLFMGAMMGAMLSLMTTNYAILSIVFFTAVYILSTVIAIGLWNKDDYPLFSKAVPKHFAGVTTVAVCVLVGLTIMASFDAMSKTNPETIIETHHHH